MIEATNFIDLIQKTSKKYNANPAFWIRRRIRKQIVKYNEIPIFINKFINFFKKENIKEKDRILVWGLNCPEYSLLMLSCFCSNRVLIPIDYRNEERLITEIAKQVKPKAAFVSKYINQDFVKKLVGKVYFIEDIFDILEGNGESKNLDYPKSFYQLNNISEIVYTSGTTGVPKGVVLTQDNIITNINAFAKSIPKLDFYKTISILPLSHIYEQIAGFLGMLPLGIDIMYLTRSTSFQILQATKEQNPTHLLFIPQLFDIFLEKIKLNAFQHGKLKKLELALKISKYLNPTIKKKLFSEIHKIFGIHFQFFGSGGAPLNFKTARTWLDMGFEILEGYGATETSAIATINKRGDFRLGSVGKPVNGIKIKIDKNNQIIICGRAVSKGYFENIEKTKAVFSKNCYKTGDMGYLDKDGYLYIKGRDSNKIVLSSGEKIYAEDLEREIKKSKPVKECCVLGFEDEGGIVPFAYVIPESNIENLDLDTFFTNINSKLESKQQIRNYKIWPNSDFPRTNTYKIDRSQVKNSLEKQDFNVKSGISMPGHIFDLFDIISNISGLNKNSINRFDNLSSDIKLDSLGRLELLSQIEEYLGIQIDEEVINQHTKVSDLEELIKNSKPATNTMLPKWQFSSFGLRVNNFLRNHILFPIHSKYVKLDIHGKENLENLKKDFIVISDHPGPLDVVTLYRILSQQSITKVATLQSSKFWERPKEFYYLNKFSEMFGGAIPLYPSGSRLIESFKLVSDLSDNGYVIIILPQGMVQTVNIKSGFQDGIAYLAKELKKPLLPIKLIGYERIWSGLGRDGTDYKDIFPKKVGQVKVVIGEPIKFEDIKNKNLTESLNFIEKRFNSLN